MRPSPLHPLRRFAFAVLVLILAATRGTAQCTREPVPAVANESRLASVGTAADDSARLGSLTGSCWGNASLIRSSLSSGSGSGVASGQLRLWVIDPTAASTWNSDIPWSFNDGPMWAGRGLNVDVSTGIQSRYRNLRVTIAPRVVTSQNELTPVIPSENGLRSNFASPWHSGAMSADLPLRFGDQRYSRVDPGESTVELDFPVVAVGVSSAEQWWGPGIRNALVMSNNAAGIPRGYIRTPRPLSTRIGDVEGQWLLGGLEESPFFDIDTRNNLRSVSAAVVTLRVAADTDLTIGAARAVYANVRRFAKLPGHLADVFVDWHRAPEGGPVEQHSDQITSLFARWVFPAAGVAAHVEWAKPRLPSSSRELLVNPASGQGYTVGLEWARAMTATTTVRAQLEFTSLEQTPDSIGGTTPEFYTSHAVIQGYTQEGQSIGAAIPPSSSSQFLGATVYHGSWQMGGSLGRIRSEDGAYYRAPSEGRFAWRAHDVSMFAELHGRRDWPWLETSVSVMRTLRMNYLFQTPDAFLPDNTTFDVHNVTMSFAVTPHLSTNRWRSRR